MAIFGNINSVKNQLNLEKFSTAFKYLEKVLEKDSEENKRVLGLALDSFEKVDLDNNNFALEQVYNTKERNNCFFESHQQYIDVQFILEGEEIIEVIDNQRLKIAIAYNKEMDLIKYFTPMIQTQIILKKGDLAIFYPEDAHMPCICTSSPSTVVKTVVKVAI